MSSSRLEKALAAIDLFQDLEPAHRARLLAELETVNVKRGALLVRQGDPSDGLYIVLSGRFEVTLEGKPGIVAEIGPGMPIGEIAFLAGGQRTANVTATRDSLVLKLGRPEFDRLCAERPAIWRALTATLARRLADQTRGARHVAGTRPKTIAIIPAGPEPMPERALDALRTTFSGRARTIALGSRNLPRLAPAASSVDGPDITQALNNLEASHDFVLYLADPTLTDWSKKAIRQADLVLRIGAFSGRDAAVGMPQRPVPLNELERFANELVQPASQRLVLIHERRGPIAGTRHWLAERPLAMHHHVALDRPADMARLWRFVDGTALGFVACGGGAFCAAHIGIFKALDEAGVSFDIFGGCSGGSAMTAAFAMEVGADAIDAAIHDVFVVNRAMRRYTWPRYSLLDHTHYDRLVARHYRGAAIEDLWTPFFAVSTNLSRYALHVHTAGDVFEAVRASGSIPALLPPVYTADGQMLVDGCLLDNVPVGVMHDLKRGPNVVVAFEVPHLERFDVDYAALPGRSELIRRAIQPFRRAALPNAPSLGSVLVRSLMANRQDFERRLRPSDLLVVPPLPDDMGILDWHRHSELVAASHAWAKSEIGRWRSEGRLPGP